MKIKNSAADIHKQFKQAFKYRTNNFRGIEKNVREVGWLIKKFLINKFMNSEEYIQLTAPEGILRGEFGLTDKIVAMMPKIVTNMFNTYQDNVGTINESFDEGSSIKIIKLGFDIVDKTYQDVDLTMGDFTVETREGELFVIEWLQWLLFRGEDIIVPDYSVRFLRGAGRSGIAIMVGGEDWDSYSIDGYFAGTPNNNWITRTVKYNAPEILKIIKDNLVIKSSRK